MRFYRLFTEKIEWKRRVIVCKNTKDGIMKKVIKLVRNEEKDENYMECYTIKGCCIVHIVAENRKIDTCATPLIRRVK